LAEYKLLPEQLLNALSRQVTALKENSWETGQNKLQYFKSCEVYLRQGAFESWLHMEEDIEESNNLNFI
jgi:hypothetical protein